MVSKFNMKKLYGLLGISALVMSGLPANTLARVKGHDPATSSKKAAGHYTDDQSDSRDQLPGQGLMGYISSCVSSGGFGLAG